MVLPFHQADWSTVGPSADCGLHFGHPAMRRCQLGAWSGHRKGPTGRRTRERAAWPPHVQFRPAACAAG
eukprot:7703958-Alexandrium_andersonii.AAC.1